MTPEPDSDDPKVAGQLRIAKSGTLLQRVAMRRRECTETACITFVSHAASGGQDFLVSSPLLSW